MDWLRRLEEQFDPYWCTHHDKVETPEVWNTHHFTPGSWAEYQADNKRFGDR